MTEAEKPQSTIPESNLAARIAEDEAMEDEIMRTPERETLDIVAEYSLQISPDILRVLMNLHARIICNPLVPDVQKQHLLDGLAFYRTHKRYHDTMGPLIRIIDAMYYKAIVESGGGAKTNITTMRQS